MTIRQRPAPRQDQIISLLGTHNAVSYGTLLRLLDANISRRRIRYLIEGLVKDGRVSRRTIHMYGGRAYYFELPTSIREALGIPRIYWATLPHNDLCALVHAELQRLFPKARFWREHEIGQNQGLRQIMAFEAEAVDSLPDILMMIPPNEGGRPVYVAIEVERMAKSTKRLLQKFTKYAVRTHLDGVIYLSEDHDLLKKLREFYRSRITTSARRIAHYPTYYFLTGTISSKHKLCFDHLQNAAADPVRIEAWAHKLAATPMVQRRDAGFATRSAVGTQESAAS